MQRTNTPLMTKAYTNNQLIQTHVSKVQKEELQYICKAYDCKLSPLVRHLLTRGLQSFYEEQEAEAQKDLLDD